MIATYYAIILVFFLIGALGIWAANRKRNRESKRQNWIKYNVYFIITNVLFLMAAFLSNLFPYVCGLISVWAVCEIVRLQLNCQRLNPLYFTLLIGFYVILSLFFILFGMLDMKTILFTLFMVLIFDAFCQIWGQILGKTNIFPTLSPNKTAEGLIGGAITGVLASLLMSRIMDMPSVETCLLGIGVCFFAFAGDLLASWIKRLYKVKDFGSSLPGHGGFLDRFDSLIPAGCFVYIFFYIING